MGALIELPESLAKRGERRTWFTRKDTDQLLDWFEESGQHFLGLNVAQKQDDGNWILMQENLDLSRQTDNFEAVRRGRVFLTEYDGEGRMFEPVWRGCEI